MAQPFVREEPQPRRILASRRDTADQIGLAIGKEGQNARLAAKLTGAKIDSQPDSIMND